MKVFFVCIVLSTLTNLIKNSCHPLKNKSLSTFVMETRNKSHSSSKSEYFTNKKTKNRSPLAIQYEEVDNRTKSNRRQKKKVSEVETEVSSANGKKVGKKNEDASNGTELENDEKKIKWEPPHWTEVLGNIREMRKEGDAPVDTLGCDQSADITLTPEVRRYHVLISLMLSSQTKDEVNHAAMCRLKQHGLTVENICNTPEDFLGKLITPVGFWKTKAKHIKMASEILIKDFNGDIPNSIPLLCKLPGVGPKMAHLAMDHAWGIVTGIGVDVHVHRISHRLGWTKVFKTPEDTRKELEAWLPVSLWSEVNHLLVGFGQQICKSIRPSCEICLNKYLCPQGKKELAERAKKLPKK